MKPSQLEAVLSALAEQAMIQNSLRNVNDSRLEGVTLTVFEDGSGAIGFRDMGESTVDDTYSFRDAAQLREALGHIGTEFDPESGPEPVLTWQMHSQCEWRFGFMVRGLVRGPGFAEIYFDSNRASEREWVWRVMDTEGQVVRRGDAEYFQDAVTAAEKVLIERGIIKD